MPAKDVIAAELSNIWTALQRESGATDESNVKYR
jgi:hypothetical protein